LEALLKKEERQDALVGLIIRNRVMSALEDGTKVAELLELAQGPYDSSEVARIAALAEYEKPEPLAYGVAGTLASYLALIFIVPGHGIGLTPEISAVLVITAGARLTWRLRQRGILRHAFREADADWQDVLEGRVLAPFLNQLKNALGGPRLELRMDPGGVPISIYGRDPELFVESMAMKAIASKTRTVNAGSLGISGPRGAGKSTILKKFDTRENREQDERDMRVLVSAPVDYDAREFIIHLFGQLCAVVVKEAPYLSPISKEASRHIEDLNYLNTYSTGWTSTLTPTALFNIARQIGKQRVEQAVGLPELVARFREFAGRMADWNQSREGRLEGRVIICIDEMDKIRESDRAVGFLNDIKAIFDVRGCLYLVSLSDDAMTVLAEKTPAIRTAFDSTFDELISVGTMTYAEAEKLLDQRVISVVPRPFLALCHVLAGGVPRELIRAVRDLIQVTDGLPPDEQTLVKVSQGLAKSKLGALRQGAIQQLSRSGAPGVMLAPLHNPDWPGLTPPEITAAALDLVNAARDVDNEEWKHMCQDAIVALSFYSTLIEVFCYRPDDVSKALVLTPGGLIDDSAIELIDGLAIARHAMRTNSDDAHVLLEEYRLRNQIGNGHGTQ
jgi:hypothetical protein